MKKVLAFLLCGVLALGTLTGCGSNNADEQANAQQEDGKNEAGDTSDDASGENSAAADLDMSKTIKMGILVSDSTTAEALAFQKYYKEYIAKNYNVELVYSDELADASAEKSAIDNFVASNCKAVISLSSFDRPAQLAQCAEAGVYYAVATGTLTDEEYEAAKTNSYYVGAIGPSLAVEYQTGYDMAKHYLDQGKTKFAIFGGAIPYYTDMHIYRAAGMIMAMIDAAGSDADYLGAKTMEEVVGKIYETASVELGTVGNAEIVGYVGGYDMDDAWFTKCGEMAATSGLEVILAVGNGSDFFATGIKGTDVKIASVDAYAEAYGEAMKAGSLDYLAGKFSASIGPIFAATYSATLGAPIRDEEGNAFALDQGYWISTTPEEFEACYAIDSSIEQPAYTKEMLDTLIGADYKTLAEFVGKYNLSDIEAMK